MIKFGPSGNSASFTNEGHVSTLDAFEWVKNRGLDLFEYSLGQGVRIGSATAKTFGEEAKRCGIEISVHAPYFINFASVEEIKVANSINYILQSLAILKDFGGERCVFHPGSENGMPRAEAFARTLKGVELMAQAKRENGYDDLIVCPETMGKIAQIGTVDEIVELCKIDETIYPCIDFGHVNAREGGILKTKDDYKIILDKLIDGVGFEKTNAMHVHFSKIEYTAKGEKRHLTFEDNVFGPEFEPLAEALIEYKLSPHILSESAGTQAEDAKFMKDVYFNLLESKKN